MGSGTEAIAMTISKTHSMFAMLILLPSLSRGVVAQDVAKPSTPEVSSTTTAEASAPVAETVAATPAAEAAAPVVAAPEAATPAVAAPVAVPVPAAAAAEKAKGKKEIYTGPTEIIALAPTPMLDEEGKQRLDPDGKPMFNKPVLQQRDKKGHPLFDEANKPVFQTATELGYDENGKKLHPEKVKPPKLTPVTIAGGTYTVDGVIGKAALNYDIADLQYIYLYAPGVGITVVSNEPFPGAKEQPAAFSDKTLTVVVGDHTLQLASDKPLLKEKKAVSAFVLVDRDFSLPSKSPVVGYGGLRKAPYVWPGAKPTVVRAGAVLPPPPPANLRPVLLMQPCPAGEMRKPAPAVLPGQVAPEQPCIPIPKGNATVIAGKAATASTTTAPASAPVAPNKDAGSINDR